MRTLFRPRLVLALVVLFAFAALLAAAQQPPPPPGPPEGTASDPQFRQRRNQEIDPHEERLRKEMEKRRNEERHAQLKEDTDKLLKLATELKEYVDKSDENLLSLEVVKKAEEIEKLAKNVQKRMKGS